ncbi:MAG TPA: benzoate-CoA ligase family protein [Pseudonocardiaceae bacterium]|nr:benzoate-CoA ligase family protein [Pseudonocardiaceae bacterium]
MSGHKAEVFNATDYLLERNLRAGNGTATAVVSVNRSLTYAELAAEVRRVAGGLRELGVRPEQRVLMCMADDVELFVAILAVMYLGAVAVPTSTMLTGRELRSLIVDSRTEIVLGSSEFANAVRTAVTEAPEVRHLVLVGPDYAGAIARLPGNVRGHSWRQLRGLGTPPARGHDTWSDSQALWLYTSGTTGNPKAAMHRHIDIKLVAELYGKQVLGITAADRCLSVAKLFFAYGIGNSMFFPMSVGATTLLEPSRPTPRGFADRARADGATLLFGSPSFWGPLLASDIPDDAFRTVRQGVSAGEALPPRMFHGMSDRFGVEVLDGIGSTEMLHIFISNRPGAVHPGSSGHPVPGYELEIRDENGTVITETDRAGELYVRGESAAIGYWCRASASREVFLGPWTRTGDTYQRNSDGTYTCLGRQGDMLKAGGIWVSPGEVEARLLEHPDVAEVVVVGVPDADDLDKPIACVVAKPGRQLDADELISWCREGLAAFKRPRAVLVMAELPRTATGKIRRNVLRGILREEPTRASTPQRPTDPPTDPPAEPAPPA